MIDVIITEFFLLPSKMAERFKNLDNILRHCAKDIVQKSRGIDRFEKQEEER